MPIPAVDADDIPSKYRKWIEEEVVHIISERERNIFFKLTANEQRDRFMEEFWAERDPTPGTEKNEFRDEHYRRIEYANKWLGRETGKPGWRTDRGRIYILLGEPKEIRRYHSSQFLVPLEMWFYEANPMLGVPPFFYAIFFKKFAVGDFIHYDPTMHGPEALVFLSAGESFDQAAMKIYQVDPELAQASVNLVPTETRDIETTTRPTLSSVQLMAQIENIPNYRRSAEYAERILRGEPKVETRYSFSDSKLSSAINMIQLGSGDNMLSYSFFFPTEVLEFGQYKDTIYTALEVLFSVTTPEGELIAERKQLLDLELTPEQKRKLQSGGLAYEDSFYLLPGEYTATLTVRNKITRVFYTTSERVQAPFPSSKQLFIYTPVLFARSENVGAINPSRIPPFAYLALKFHPILNEFLTRGQEIGVFYQVYAPAIKDTSGTNQQLQITYRLLSESGAEIKKTTVGLESRQFSSIGTGSVFWRFATEDLEFGKYRLEVTAAYGEDVAQAQSQLFEIRREGGVAEPLTYYGPPLDFSGSAPVIAKAQQLLNLSRPDIAVRLLTSAHSSWPGDDEISSLYAEALTEEGKLDEAADILLEISLRHPTEPVWKRKLGMLHLRLGSFNKAIGYLEQVRLQEGDSVEVLNPLGEAYRFSENNTKAIEIWERSIEIEPGQPLIEERLKQLRESSQDLK